MIASPALVPLEFGALAGLVAADDPSPRAVALRHAMVHARPGLWGDHPVRPSCAVWLRDAGSRLEAFAAGRPEAAVSWLAVQAQGRPIALAAPPDWESALHGKVSRGTVRSWSLDAGRRVLANPVLVRRLGPDEGEAFEQAAPAWASLAWGHVASLLTKGVAFGVPHGSGYAALSWIFETDGRFAKLGVATGDRFRRLGLGRAVASAMIEAMARVDPSLVPLWTAAAENTASAALARSLGFANPCDEALLIWEPSSLRETGQ